MKTRAVLEVAAILFAGSAFLVVENVLHAKLWFLVPCAIAGAAYVAERAIRDPGRIRAWGLRTDNLGPAALPCAIFLVAAVAALALYRLAAGWIGLPGGWPALLVLYPVWALVQQFAVQGLVARNLERLGAPRAATVAAAAVLFGLAHLPDWRLAAMCAGAGAVWTVFYLRRPNLFPLALTHAWLGMLVYAWVLERDPWGEMFPPG
jgi:hypothetical protein